MLFYRFLPEYTLSKYSDPFKNRFLTREWKSLACARVEWNRCVRWNIDCGWGTILRMHTEIVICKCHVLRINMKWSKERKMSREKDIKMNPKQIKSYYISFLRKNLKENNIICNLNNHLPWNIYVVRILQITVVFLKLPSTNFFFEQRLVFEWMTNCLMPLLMIIFWNSF